MDDSSFFCLKSSMNFIFEDYIAQKFMLFLIPTDYFSILMFVCVYAYVGVNVRVHIYGERVGSFW